jgi:hypothetical protein
MFFIWILMIFAYFTKVDPNVGNAAVAAILVELASPLLFILSATMKGKIEG